ncbi:hypothetical protein [Lysinibacillus sp. NPDC059133]|uniref:hypothetical protein n=1 Tax=Lysinibacillus sp. NPDC059133 TaxID=3346737 RepID=UPI003687A99E
MFICAKAKRQQQMFSVAKAKRQQQMFICAKAKRQQQQQQFTMEKLIKSIRTLPLVRMRYMKLHTDIRTFIHLEGLQWQQLKRAWQEQYGKSL